MKSTVEQIRERFDNDVDRFSNLEIGQAAAIDSPLGMELITHAAATVNPQARHVLDVGCGAGNYTVKLLQRLPGVDVTLVDLSQPMLTRAVERVAQAGGGQIRSQQADIRALTLDSEQFDIVLTASVLHHLRAEEEWQAVFAKLYAALRPGGSIWIFDLIEQSMPTVQRMMWQRYGEYLAGQQGEAYRDKVYDYVEAEDTPRPLLFQLDLLRAVGFEVDILHKNGCFAAFGGVKR